jgi:DnaJ-class molecular chaperone
VPAAAPATESFRSCPTCRGHQTVTITVQCPTCGGEGSITARQILGLLEGLVSPGTITAMAGMITAERHPEDAEP